MTSTRAIERTNPWGLTELEFAVMASVIATGSSQGAADTLGLDLRAVDNAMHRVRQKMAAGTTVLAVARWVTWKLEQRAGQPRTAWVCQGCNGMGFTVRRG
jgi:FixJ family two-component response regulator